MFEFGDAPISVSNVACQNKKKKKHLRGEFEKHILCKINVKKIAFKNKEHTEDQKMGVSVLLWLFMSSNKVCNTAYALLRIHEQNSIFKWTIMGPVIPKEMKYKVFISLRYKKKIYKDI